MYATYDSIRTEAGDGAVKGRDAHLQPSVNVGKGLAVRVVAVQGDLVNRHNPLDGVQQQLDVTCVFF